MKFKYSLATAVTLALLQGCGGGGGDGSSPTPSTSSATGPTWKAGDFSQPSKTFINQCETPASDWTHMTTMPPIQINWALHCTKNSF